MIRYTVLHDVILSMHLEPFSAPIVADRTQRGVGWACLGAALAGHAGLACLLLWVHQPSSDARPAQPMEVTLDIIPAETTALPAVVARSIPADAPPPANDPEAPLTRPEPAVSIPPSEPRPEAAPAPVPAALPRVAEPVPATISAQRDQRRPASQANPVRQMPKPTIKAAALPARRHQAAEPSPSDASFPPALPASPVLSATPPQQALVPVQSPTPEAAGAWRGALAAWLQDHRTYPDEARRDGTEGRAVVRFTIDRSGLVTAVALVSSSGSALLDEAAQTLLRGAHVPPPPAPAPDHLSVTLPVRYTLAH